MFNLTKDIWDVLDDEEKTLDIVARFANLSMHVGPENQVNCSVFQSLNQLSYPFY